MREYEDGTTLKDKGRKDFIHTDNKTSKNWLGLLKSVPPCGFTYVTMERTSEKGMENLAGH